MPFINKPTIQYIQWSITRKCNYDCSYCVSSGRKLIKTQEISPLIIFDHLQNRLNGRWHFFMSGSGDSFVASYFLETIKKIISAGHKVGVQTNFSMPIQKIKEFIDICGNKLLRLDASLHLEYEKPDVFLKKALKIKRLIGDRLKVSSLARPGQVDKIKNIYRQFRTHGIRLYPQLERDYKNNSIFDPFVHYSRAEQIILGEISGNLPIKLNKPDNLKFKGKKCWTGRNYFILNEQGEAWRCVPARRQQDKNNGYLGNVIDPNFKLCSDPEPCNYNYCYCQMPHHLGLVET